MIEELVRLYEEGLNDAQIGEKLGITTKHVWYQRSKLGLKSKFSYKEFRTIDEESLKKLVLAGKKDAEIAEILNVSAIGIYHARVRYGFTRKAFNKDKTIDISQRQLEILTGCLLGDGSLRLAKDSINPSFTCMHGIKQKEYCYWKFKELESCTASYGEHKRLTPDKRNGIYYEDATVRIGNKTNFNSLYNSLYTSSKVKIISLEFLKNFSDLSLAVMFMDDGSRANKTIAIATNCFSIEDLTRFNAFCLGKWGFYFTITKSNLIYLPTRFYKIFKKVVIKHMHPTLMYKLP